MQTVIGAFDTSAQAEKAAQDLIGAGIKKDDISLIANNEGGRFDNVTETTSEGTTLTGHAVGHDAKVGAEWGAGIGLLIGLTGLAVPGFGWIVGGGWLMAGLSGMLTGAVAGAVVGGLTGALTHVGVPQEDAEHYSAAVQHGSFLLAIRASDTEAHRVAEILDNDGAINIDERVDKYKQAGFIPAPSVPMNTPPVTAAPVMKTATTTTPMTTPKVNATGEQVLDVVEENLALGKREVQRGGVRVFTHVTERPVQESINLREEHVTVERHAVDLPATAAAFTAAREGVIEVTETAEVPVVSKEARIVEEVVVGKEHTERVETVHDTVRRTDVEVEQIAGQTTTTGTKPIKPL